MLRKCFSFLPHQSLAVVMLAASLIPAAWAQPKFKILATVPGGLFSGLTFDAKGNLYGVTGAGGDDNQGTIFELAPGAHGWTLHTLHSFDGQHGGSPNGGLIFDAAGNFYGTTQAGGSGRDGGTVFEMVRGSSGWNYTVLYNFCLQYHCLDGGFPGPLSMDGSGDLYGVAAGGTYDEGVAFELTPGSGQWDESVLYNFEGTESGFDPSGPLIFGPNGSLYGTTAGTFNSEAGTVFDLSWRSTGWRHRKLWQFDEADGAGPGHGVVFDKLGILYGTANGGTNGCNGSPCGVVFRLALARNGKWKEAVIYDFTSERSGWLPSSGVVIDGAGNLYGTTGVGGVGG